MPRAEKETFRRYFLRTTIDALGFGALVRAFRAQEGKTGKVGRALAAKAFDLTANNGLEVLFMAVLLAAWSAAPVAALLVATGVFSGLYTYGKFYLIDRFRAPAEQRRRAKLIDRERFLKGGIAFFSGCLTGVAGSLLRDTAIAQPILGPAEKAFSKVREFLPPLFNGSAARLAVHAPVIARTAAPRPPAA